MKLGLWNIVIGVALIAVFFSIVAAIAYMLYGPGFKVTVLELLRATEPEATNVLEKVPGTLYECESEKALKAEFTEVGVNVALSDGRQVRLPQTPTASGVRYANTDATFVFHTNDYGAFVEENGTMTYKNCAATMPN